MTNHNDHKPSLRDAVLEAIQSGNVTMRPKWHFVLRAILALVGIGIVVLTLLYLASFILFLLRRSGMMFVPVFGARGWFIFIRSLPWLLFALLALFIVVLQILVQHYSFAYRKPLVYSVVGIVVIVIAGGSIVAQTSFHRRFMRNAERHHVPFAEPFYRQFGHPRFRSIHRGIITQAESNGFTMSAQDEEPITVMISPKTRLPLGADFSAGDMVVVFGDLDDHTIEAFGVRKIDDQSPLEP